MALLGSHDPALGHGRITLIAETALREAKVIPQVADF
jgi:hypothetical protein